MEGSVLVGAHRCNSSVLDNCGNVQLMKVSDIFKVQPGVIFQGVITGEKISSKLSHATRMSEQHPSADVARADYTD